MAARWTQRDKDYVHDNVGILSYEELASRLNRTPEGVKQLRKRYWMPTVFGNILSSGMLSLELGKSRGAIAKWRKHGWIKCKRVSWIARYGKRPVIFKEEDVVSFLKAHYKLFNFRKIPNRYFANIVEECYQKAS